MLFKKIFANTAAVFAARILFRLANALVAILVARYLGVERFGAYATALALVNTFLIANDIGSTTLILKKGSREKEKIGHYFGNSIIIQLFASLGFFILALAVGWILDYDLKTQLLVILLGSGTIIFEFRKSFRAVLSILLKLKFVAFLEVIAGLLTLIGVYAISKIVWDKDLGLLLVAAIPLIVNVFFILSVFFYDLKFIKPQFSWLGIKAMLKEGYIYSLYNIFYTIYLQVGTLMVQAYQGNEEAGLYSAAAKLIILILILPQMIFQVALPLLFRYIKEDREKYKRVHLFIFRYLNALGIPLAVGMWLLADPIIELVYHKSGYQPAALALQIMAIFLLARFLGNISGQSLTAIDQQKKKVIVEISSVVLLIILNIFFIPQYGFTGAALATVLVEIAIRISFVLMDMHYLKNSFFTYIKTLIIPGLSALIMGLFIYFTKEQLNVILAVILGALVYASCLFIGRFIKPYDWNLFKQLIPSRLTKLKKT